MALKKTDRLQSATIKRKDQCGWVAKTKTPVSVCVDIITKTCARGNYKGKSQNFICQELNKYRQLALRDRVSV